jgi:(1->4)-alpha-D-glucan 1-alpha-D-glucosylmutase
MDRYVCIHGHFYQPPRENAWLETVEVQDSAYPYHDWNERITAECYGPNAFARILDDKGRIAKIVNNYAKISFNFGPTLLAWLEDKAPDVYAAILDADRQAQQRFSGHGSALAMPYNHMILPLANRRDKHTQIVWGLGDFERRFARAAEGMWLPETAVDLETLELLATKGIRFTVLATHQAHRVRKLGETEWHEVTGGQLDPTMPYLTVLPSGKSLCIFFYDGPIARAVAFEHILYRAETFVARLRGALSDTRRWPQLVHIATDGESYGHHHAHGDMGLAYALEQIDADPDVKLTNYGEYLARHSPTHQVEIWENTSWSCIHGVERWRGHCGCNSGRAGWTQHWRKPLREAMDWLRDELAQPFEELGRQLLKDPWAARDAYIHVLLDRSDDSLGRFFADQAAHALTESEHVVALKLLELQRHAQLMYTSCGWFFDEISGLESVQVLQYAARALQLADELFAEDLESGFLKRLECAKSNLPEHASGRAVYEKWVRAIRLDWERLGAHYAVRSLFETYPQEARLYCFTARSEAYHTFQAGKAKLAVGRARITSEITREAETLTFGVLHFGDHNLNGGVRKFQGPEYFAATVEALSTAFAKADFAEIIRLMDQDFGESTYSLRSLFRDEQRKIIKQVLQPVLADAEGVYRRLYEQHLPTMRFLADLHVPMPRAFQTAAEFIVNTDLSWAFKDDEPNLEHVRALMKEAVTWKVPLDTAGLSYRLKRMTERVSNRFRAQPTDLSHLTSLEEVVDLVRTLPFEVDLWQPQNTYYEMLHKVLPQFQLRARRGDDSAWAWVERFLTLGEKMGVHVSEQQRQTAEYQKIPSVARLVEEVLAQRRIPAATYRLQMNKDFTFAQAREVVAYLHELGITDVYTSPLLQARPGSPHGYDITDHGRLNSELGGDQEFEAFNAALRERGLGLVLDMVPNHMGIGHVSNGWWMDVLENGPSSVCAHYFDIDWHPTNPNLRNKVLIPILEDQYGAVLDSGKIRLAFEEGAFFIYYYEHKVPVGPHSYHTILDQRLPALKEQLGENHEDVQELHSVITAISYLPQIGDGSTEKITERNREKEVIKRRIAALAGKSAAVRSAIEETVKAFNGTPGDPASFDALHRLLETQAYRAAFWRVAGDEINYRRFFDINDLAAIRVELPEVFQATHQLVFKLLAEGKVTGLRIDHPDGLWDPARYFRALQESFVAQRVRARLGEYAPEGLEREVAERLEGLVRAGSPAVRWPLYVVAEKILVDKEPLPGDWAVEGTTGYDFLSAAGGIFVHGDNREAFDAVYVRFIGRRPDYAALITSCQKIIMLVSMASEVHSLGHQLDRVSERNRRFRDFTLNSLTFALREVIAALPVYRTYITGAAQPSERDRRFIEEAVELAKDQNPRTAEAIFHFIRDSLLLRTLQDFREEDRPSLVDWAMRFQQVTGPVLAKGLEDTAFYTYNRLVSLNEVGGHPEHFGVPVQEFHAHNLDRMKNWPHTLLASSTHDTKRSEDVRARINLLSEIPEDWEAALARWVSLNAAKKAMVENVLAPERNDEYLLYQTLVGVWPVELLTPETVGPFRERIVAYMLKAIKEAKVHTSWVNPNQAYDEAMHNFVSEILPDNPDEEFVKDIEKFAGRLTFLGFFNSLSQLVLKLASPGVPDVYQGQELWDFSLVDPDNRRPVDYVKRQEVLRELKDRIEKGGASLLPLAKELLTRISDGRIKMYVLYRALHFRIAHPQLFEEGAYTPLQAEGEKADYVCAFARTYDRQHIVAVVPRLVLGLTGGAQRPPIGLAVWRDSRLLLPADQPGQVYQNLFTGERLTGETSEGKVALPLAKVLASFPVALLVAESPDTARLSNPG